MRKNSCSIFYQLVVEEIGNHPDLGSVLFWSCVCSYLFTSSLFLFSSNFQVVVITSELACLHCHFAVLYPELKYSMKILINFTGRLLYRMFWNQMQWSASFGFTKNNTYISCLEEVHECESSVTVKWWKSLLFILLEGKEKKMAIEIKSNSAVIFGE